MLENLVWHAAIAVPLLLFVLAALLRLYLIRRTRRNEALERIYGPESIHTAVLADLVLYQDDSRLEFDTGGEDWDFHIDSRGLKRLQLLGLAYCIVQAAAIRLRQRPHPLPILHFLLFLSVIAVVIPKILIKPHANDVRTLVGFDTLIASRLAGAGERAPGWERAGEVSKIP